MTKETKDRNHLWNLLKTEWRYLLKRKKIFIVTVIMFVIAQSILLMNPLIIGLIFNSIQESISTTKELKRLIFLISLLL